MEGEEKGEKEKEKKKIPKNRKKKDERRAQAALRRNLNDQCDPSASYNRTAKIESADPPKEPPKESKVKDKDEDTIDFPKNIKQDLMGNMRDAYKSNLAKHFLDMLSVSQDNRTGGISKTLKAINTMEDDRNCTICENKTIPGWEDGDRLKTHFHLSTHVDSLLKDIQTDGKIDCSWCINPHEYVDNFRAIDLIVDQSFGDIQTNLCKQLTRHINITQVKNRNIKETLTAYMKEGGNLKPRDIIVILSPAKDLLENRPVNDIIKVYEEFGNEVLEANNSTIFPAHGYGNTVSILPSLMIPRYCRYYKKDDYVVTTQANNNNLHVWAPKDEEDFTIEFLVINKKVTELTEKLHNRAEELSGHKLFKRFDNNEDIPEGPNIWKHGRKIRKNFKDIDAQDMINAGPDRPINLNNRYEDIEWLELKPGSWVIPHLAYVDPNVVDEQIIIQQNDEEMEVENQDEGDFQNQDDFAPIGNNVPEQHRPRIEQLNKNGAIRLMKRITKWINGKNSLKVDKEKLVTDNLKEIMDCRYITNHGEQAICNISTSSYNITRRIDILATNNREQGATFVDINICKTSAHRINDRIVVKVGGEIWRKPNAAPKLSEDELFQCTGNSDNILGLFANIDLNMPPQQQQKLPRKRISLQEYKQRTEEIERLREQQEEMISKVEDEDVYMLQQHITQEDALIQEIVLENSQKWDSSIAIEPKQGYGYDCATPYTESKQQGEDFYDYNYDVAGARPKHRRIESDIVRLPGNITHTLPIKSTIFREEDDDVVMSPISYIPTKVDNDNSTITLSEDEQESQMEITEDMDTSNTNQNIFGEIWFGRTNKYKHTAKVLAHSSSENTSDDDSQNKEVHENYLKRKRELNEEGLLAKIFMDKMNISRDAHDSEDEAANNIKRVKKLCDDIQCATFPSKATDEALKKMAATGRSDPGKFTQLKIEAVNKQIEKLGREAKTANSLMKDKCHIYTNYQKLVSDEKGIRKVHFTYMKDKLVVDEYTIYPIPDVNHDKNKIYDAHLKRINGKWDDTLFITETILHDDTINKNIIVNIKNRRTKTHELFDYSSNDKRQIWHDMKFKLSGAVSNIEYCKIYNGLKPVTNISQKSRITKIILSSIFSQSIFGRLKTYKHMNSDKLVCRTMHQDPTLTRAEYENRYIQPNDTEQQKRFIKKLYSKHHLDTIVRLAGTTVVVDVSAVLTGLYNGPAKGLNDNVFLSSTLVSGIIQHLLYKANENYKTVTGKSVVRYVLCNDAILNAIKNPNKDNESQQMASKLMGKVFLDFYDNESNRPTETLIIPIIDNSHFNLIIIDGKTGNIVLFDSNEDRKLRRGDEVRNKGIYCINGVNTEERLTYLLKKANAKTRVNFRFLESAKYKLQQNDNRNCGPYVLEAVKFLTDGKVINQKSLDELFSFLKNNDIMELKRQMILDTLLCKQAHTLMQQTEDCRDRSTISVARKHY